MAVADERRAAIPLRLEGREKEEPMGDPLLWDIDDVVKSWPDVKAKQVFGHRGYVRSGKMFGFIAEGGAAVKVVSDEDAAELFARDGVKPFAYSGMEMRGWAVLPIRSKSDVDDALSWMSRSYEGVAGRAR